MMERGLQLRIEQEGVVVAHHLLDSETDLAALLVLLQSACQQHGGKPLLPLVISIYPCAIKRVEPTAA